MRCLRATVLGMLWCLAFGCQRDRPLGDLESGAGQAGDGAGTNGDGGTKGGFENGGTAMGGFGSGGFPVGEAGNGGFTSGGSANGGSPTGGSTNGGSSNGGSGGPGEDCFSPDQSPELALEPGATGCDCAAEEVDQCIAIGEETFPHLVGMGCRNGRWSGLEDGPCEPDPTVPWGCMIENRVFKDAGPVPEEFMCRLCSWCEISHPACQVILCVPPSCPTDTVQGSRCRACGMGPGGCDIVEHGCFPECQGDEECEFGSCTEQNVCDLGLICI